MEFKNSLKKNKQSISLTMFPVMGYKLFAHRRACMTEGSIWTIDAGMLSEVEHSSPEQFMSCMGFPGKAYTSTPVALDSTMFFILDIQKNC